MIAFLDNPWVIGILSGIIVAVITPVLFSRRDRKELAQKVVMANQEILFAIRPEISEGNIPEQKVLDSLMSATAKKYNLELAVLMSKEELADELIKQIMDSSFISSQSKKDFCDKILEIKKAEKEVMAETEKSSRLAGQRGDGYRRRFLAMISVSFGLVTAYLTVALTYLENTEATLSEPLGNIFFAFISALTSLLMASIVAFYLYVRARVKRPRQHEEKESSMEM